MSVRPPAQKKDMRKVGGEIRFDSIVMGKSGRDRVIIEWFPVGR